VKRVICEAPYFADEITFYCKGIFLKTDHKNLVCSSSSDTYLSLVYPSFKE